jgi:hypothetical protein
MTAACFDAAAIARAATLETEEVDAHFASCLACRRALDADRRTRASLAALATPALSPLRRTALAAEVLAHAAMLPRTQPVHARRRSRLPAVMLATAAAAAAALVIVAHVQAPAATSPTLSAVHSDETPGMHAQRVAADDGAPTLPPPSIVTHGGATLTHRVGDDRDVLVLVDGIIDVDTRSTRDVDVHVGSSTIRVDDASVRIRASKHAIVSVQVVVGAARVIAPDQHVVLERDSVWLPSGAHGDQSLTAFRDAWIELRAGHDREAMELFDRVTDPVVLEEAMYWAAVAAQRTGDPTLGEARMRAFHRRFPGSELGH